MKKSKNINNHLFATLAIDEKKDDFCVYLVNNSDKHYKAVKMLTGAYVSIDEDLMETSKITKDKGKFSARSAMKIDESDLDELGYVIWYWVDLVDDCGKILQYALHLPKYGWASDEGKRVLPILGNTGLMIDLEERDGESIAEEVKTMDMGSKYHKYSDL